MAKFMANKRKTLRVVLVGAVFGLLPFADAHAQAFNPNPLIGYGTPQDSNVAILTTATAVGTPAKYHVIYLENEGTAAVCGTFTTQVLVAPAGSICAVGFYLAPGQVLSFSASNGMLPNSQLEVIAAAAATSVVWFSAQ